MNRVVRLDYAYGVCPRCGSRDKLCYLIRQDGMMHKPHEVKCINCNSYFTREGVELQPKQKTNADCIRAMTDKDLAEFLAEYRCVHKAPHCMETNCAQCWLDWLRQEATDADN